jgi:hypothetical protein
MIASCLIIVPSHRADRCMELPRLKLKCRTLLAMVCAKCRSSRTGSNCAERWKARRCVRLDGKVPGDGTANTRRFCKVMDLLRL